ncbi:PREDICTED: GDSL esterase/lipase At1g09390-like isoform X2 [Lupinus angustifolius]|uniref:GDSL esterase/lipase At1g09390-like isoform X1 n=1 Tax=Lupinus angustifolius TaxID=3871 RepID=UPI00092EAE7E|nr:PREDICTED: GDSL esterase/lipase At1g09390-like isoform X1 [Lupinus angustifolius]XP_019422449.1 PREDICTED: GDSL esterase/lipase At1g09390-like isoform X2 [Lupinus angustifolius]
MGHSQSLTFLLLLLFTISSSSSAIGLNNPNKGAVLFVFGDSNSDTGGLASGLGFPINFPNGRTFFHRSTGRLSDGRLIIDLLCQSLNISFLIPYLDPLSGTTFTNGANFAVVGSSTLPKYVPFSLNIQVMQFLHFKARTLELVAAGSRNLISDEGFRNALYLIDIGQNDIADSFAKNMSYAQVIKRIPSVITEIENALKSLYNQGARKFWVHNTGPLGCLPKILSLTQKKDLDSFGCLSSYNSAARLFNGALQHLTQKLRNQLNGATIVYVDIYAIKYDIITNAAKYGFSNPLIVCCGFGGPPYNFDARVPCGQPGNQVCDEGSKYVSWDGTHLTEAANTLIASRILSSAYSIPKLPFDFFTHH